MTNPLQKELTRKEARKLVREFHKVHSEYSSKNAGYFKPSWKKEMKYADVKYGHWFWRGYDLSIIYKKYGWN